MLPGADHAGAIRDVDAVLELVLEFLAVVSPSGGATPAS
jgi:hypothetical protein